MELIVDANIIFAALIKDGVTPALLCNTRFCLFTPEFVFDEFEKYEIDILAKTYRSSEDFKKFMGVLKSKIRVLSKKDVFPYIEKAKNICPDCNDIPYFACALAKKCPIWSNDKKLKEQLVDLVLNTSEQYNKIN